MKEFLYSAIFERIVEKSRWKSEGELAKALGISANTWTSYKKGASSFGLHEVPRICDVLGVSPHWLLFGDEGVADDLRSKISALVEDVYAGAQVRLPPRSAEEATDRHYLALQKHLVDPADREEVELRLRLLRKELLKEIMEAASEPGSGKQSA